MCVNSLFIEFLYPVVLVKNASNFFVKAIVILYGSLYARHTSL